jgi:hypothetical protein
MCGRYCNILAFKILAFLCVNARKKHPYDFILYIQATRKLTAFLRNAA